MGLAKLAGLRDTDRLNGRSLPQFMQELTKGKTVESILSDAADDAFWAAEFAKHPKAK